MPLLQEAIKLLTPPGDRRETEILAMSMRELGTLWTDLGLLEEAERFLLEAMTSSPISPQSWHSRRCMQRWGGTRRRWSGRGRVRK